MVVDVEAIRAVLRAEGDPERAPRQQAYMKSALPFHGVSVPRARRIATEAAKGHDAAELRAAARRLWDGATHREELYAAMALLSTRSNRGARELLPLIEHMVRTGRWWDITDELAHRVADLLDAHPEETATRMRAWSRDEDLWIRRVAIICQLGRKERMDTDLLTEVIEANATHADFFIRKAIGWALRDRARVDPDGVRAFVREHDLSPLSVREAVKHL